MIWNAFGIKKKERCYFSQTAKADITIKSSIFKSVSIQNLNLGNFDLLDQSCLKEAFPVKKNKKQQ